MAKKGNISKTLDSRALDLWAAVLHLPALVSVASLAPLPVGTVVPIHLINSA